MNAVTRVLRIYTIRARGEVPQAEFAKRLGVSQSTLSRIESGEVDSVRVEHVFALAAATGTPAPMIIAHVEAIAAIVCATPDLPDSAIAALCAADGARL